MGADLLAAVRLDFDRVVAADASVEAGPQLMKLASATKANQEVRLFKMSGLSLSVIRRPAEGVILADNS